MCSSRLRFKETLAANKIELELITSPNSSSMYLNAYSLQIPSVPNTSEQSYITIAIEGEKYQATAHRLRGGQRLLLRNETRDFIVHALQCGKTVKLQVGRYTTNITPEGFRELYSKV